MKLSIKKPVRITAREAHIANLMRPITLDCTSSIRARQNYVEARRQKVWDALPLLTDEERITAKAWLDANKFLGLWD